MSDQLKQVQENLEMLRDMFGGILSKAAGDWTYNKSTGNFLHPLHGAVKIRQHEDGGMQVVHNGKIISTHGADDKAGAIKSAGTHMRSLLGKAEGQEGDTFMKDDLDEKIKAKLKAEMDKRNFGEADATKHVIDRDRGAKMPKPPKAPKPLLQSEQDGGADAERVDRDADAEEKKTFAVHGEVAKCGMNGQWKIEKSNYGPKGMGLYNQNDNAKRKAKNTGDVVADAGKNVNVKSYTTTGASMGAAASAAEEKRQKAANKKAPVRSMKDFTPEELAQIGTSRKP
jgi:hypothetical protein